MYLQYRGCKGIIIKPANIPVNSRHNINGVICVIRYLLGKISETRRKELEDAISDLMNSERDIKTNDIIKNCTKITI